MTLFDRFAREYDAALEEGIRLSGEPRDYFAKGRVRFLAGELRRRGVHDRVRRILDFGCGTGETSFELLQAFPCVEVVGVDPSPWMISEARERRSHPALRFDVLEAGPIPGSGYDLAYAANVFHHVEPRKRLHEMRRIADALVPGGFLAFFENNPWSPAARAVMARVPFDRDAVPLSILEALRWIRAAGLEAVRARSLFYFPRFLARLRWLEPILAPLPFGAQYAVICCTATSG